MSNVQVLSYGGGRQTVALCVLIRRGILPRPDRIVIADTGRENPMTWAYLAAHVRPLLAEIGLGVEVAGHELATVDLYAKNGDLLMPLHTPTGKLPGFCSDEWKRRVIARYLRGVRGEMWIGFSLDERRRVARMAANNDRRGWEPRFPLVELMLTSADCEKVVRDAGLPATHRSSCWMCPHKSNAEWRVIRDEHPAEWAMACDLDDELREYDRDNGRPGVWLHHSRVPLREADLDTPEPAETARQCGLGLCFV